ncbi:MAG: response regulator [Ruminococcaceae bacterium]|nr:response regulator [Oscillospiraceae bacterium]
MRVLLVDDEDLQLIRLTKAVKKVLPEDAALHCYNNPLQALQENTGKKFDIAFIDIEMPVISGMQLAKKLKETNPNINIIFVTAYEQYAKDAYTLHASGYITKPVNEEKVREEMENLRYPIKSKNNKPLQIKCFGNFEVFADGMPVKFQYSKSKELFAYLVDREGAAISINELNAVLWSEDHKSYLRNLIADIQATLEAVGAGEVFVKRRNECFIDVDKVDCDAYEYKRNNPGAVLAYNTEYMKQYSWLTS